MKKTIQTIFTTSLALVCTFFMQQLSAKEIAGNELPEPWLIAKVKNDTRFTAHVTVYYTTAPNKPETFDVGPHSSGQGGDRKLLIKSVSATYDAIDGGAVTVTQSVNFVAPASTAYGEFVIKEERLTVGQFACKIYRVDASGTLIHQLKPGFVFINKTSHLIRVRVFGSYDADNNLSRVLAPGERWTQDFHSGKWYMSATVVPDYVGSPMYINSTNQVTLSEQSSGDPQLWSTASVKPTYEISGGQPVNLVLQKIN